MTSYLNRNTEFRTWGLALEIGGAIHLAYTSGRGYGASALDGAAIIAALEAAVTKGAAVTLTGNYAGSPPNPIPGHPRPCFYIRELSVFDWHWDEKAFQAIGRVASNKTKGSRRKQTTKLGAKV